MNLFLQKYCVRKFIISSKYRREEERSEQTSVGSPGVATALGLGAPPLASTRLQLLRRLGDGAPRCFSSFFDLDVEVGELCPPVLWHSDRGANHFRGFVKGRGVNRHSWIVSVKEIISYFRAAACLFFLCRFVPTEAARSVIHVGHQLAYRAGALGEMASPVLAFLGHVLGSRRPG